MEKTKIIAMESCETARIAAPDHFREVTKMVTHRIRPSIEKGNNLSYFLILTILHQILRRYTFKR